MNMYIHSEAEARAIREFRIDQCCTWSMVAIKAALLWPDKGIYAGELIQGEYSGSSLTGRELCDEAAPFFNESSREEPWN